MKIIMIGQKGVPMGRLGGGIERHVEELASRLVKKGHKVIAYVRPWYLAKVGFKGVSLRGVKLVRVPSLYTKNLDTISHTFFASIHAVFQKADIIHYHGVGPSTMSWIPKLFSPRSKIIVTFHSQDRFHKKWGLFARMYLGFGEWTATNLPHATIVVSQALKEYVVKRFRKTSVNIPNGVSLLPVPDPKEIMNEFHVEPKKYILTAARLVRHKGIHTLIQAYQGVKTDKSLIIVGAPSFTKDYDDYLRGLAHGNPNISFLGFQGGKTLAALFGHAYLYVHPSESEGLSLSILEAMSFGSPVLVSDIPENKEAVDGCGFLFRSKDVHDLRVKLQTLINQSSQLKERGKCGKDLIKSQFDWDIISQKTETLYKDVIGGIAAEQPA